MWAEEGETVHTGLFDFTVSGVSVVESYGSLETEEGSRLVRMDLTVTNTSNEAYLMFSQDFQLQWGDGTEDFGTCLPAVDEEMTPYAYTLEPVSYTHLDVYKRQIRKRRNSTRPSTRA